MSKNNHTNPRPKLIEFKLHSSQNANLRHIDWLECEILRLELNTLLLHGDTDYSVRAIPYEEQWRGEWEQNRMYVLKRIQVALGKNDIVATMGNIADALKRISHEFEDADSLSARQFSPYAMEYWVEKAKERGDYWAKQRKKA